MLSQWRCARLTIYKDIQQAFGRVLHVHKLLLGEQYQLACLARLLHFCVFRKVNQMHGKQLVIKNSVFVHVSAAEEAHQRGFART